MNAPLSPNQIERWPLTRLKPALTGAAGTPQAELRRYLNVAMQS